MEELAAVEPVVRHSQKTTHLKTDEYYPNHLIHAILSEHCASETGDLAGNTHIKPGDTVRISENNPTFQTYTKENPNEKNLNQELENWFVLRVTDNAMTGYMGILYVNHMSRHLVFAHWSTNFSLSLRTKNLFMQSGVHQDIKGVLMLNVTLHQGIGFLATHDAVGIANSPMYKMYSLSFTGHSLGAWLATLSVFYCHDYFNYDFAEAVTFDGPGPKEMMMKLRENQIGSAMDLNDMDIVSYLSAPNIVNCANRHVGTVYTIFPINILNNPSDGASGKNARALKGLQQFIFNHIPQPILTNFGHHFKYMLPHFGGTQNGRPKTYNQVTSWPCISYSDFKNPSSSFNAESKLLKCFASMLPIRGTGLTLSAVGIVTTAMSLTFKWQSTSLDSIVHLALAFYSGEINMDQFWLVHQFLDKNIGFIESTNLGPVDQFRIRYAAQYAVIEPDHNSDRFKNSKVDRCLGILSKLRYKSEERERLQGEELRKIVDKYRIDSLNTTIVVVPEFNRNISVDCVRNMMKSSLRRSSHFEQFLIHIEENRLPENLDYKPRVSLVPWDRFERFDNGHLYDILFGSQQIAIVKGIQGSGKTALVKSFANEYKTEFTARFLLSDSVLSLQNSIKECLRSTDLELSGKHEGTIQSLVCHLEMTKQQVVFVMDDTRDVKDISDFIQAFASQKFVRFIITTRNDRLIHDNKYFYETRVPEMSQTQIFDVDGIRYEIRTKCKELVSGNEAIHLATRDLLKLLCFVKSGEISSQHLKLCLPSTREYAFSDTENAISLLQRLSFITEDDSNKLCANSFIREISTELFTSAFDCFKFLTLFRPTQVVLDAMFKKILSFECQIISGHKELKFNFLDFPVEHKCNLMSILTLLLHHLHLNNPEPSMSSPNRNQIIESLENVRKFLNATSDEVLESFMVDLTHDWSHSHGEHLRKKYFMTNQKRLRDLLELFNIFGDRVKRGFDLSNNIVGDIKDYDHIVVIGQTGSGKSTFINFRAGHQLECEEAAGHGRQTKIIAKAQSSTQMNPIADIGCNQAISQTKAIQAYYGKVENGRTVVYWDFPGFGDSRGSTNNIELAFLLKSFSRSLPTFKVVLVIDDSTTSKGNGFVSLVNSLSQLCPQNQIYPCISLLITKGDTFTSPRRAEEDKQSYKDKYNDFLNAHMGTPYEWFLRVLCDITPTRTAFFPRVSQEGNISDSSFVDLDKAFSSRFGQIHFNLSVDSETSDMIKSLTHLLNYYALHVIGETVRLREIDMRKRIQKVTFEKQDLLLIRKFGIISKTRAGFLAEIKIALGDSDLQTLRTIENILDTIELFHKLDSKCEPLLLNWVALFKDFDHIYDELVKPSRFEPSTADGWFAIKSVIITASEIQSLYEERTGQVHMIQCYSYIFIQDMDLELPGVDFSVTSERWVIIGDFKHISLKGLQNEQVQHSGNFCGFGKIVEGGKLVFNLDGVDGRNGEFSSSSIMRKINDISSVLNDVSSKLSKLESLKRRGIIANEDELKQTELGCQRNLRYLENEIVERRQSFSNFLEEGTTRIHDDIIIEELEQDIRRQKIELRNVCETLKFIQDLKQTIAVEYNEHKNNTIGKYLPTREENEELDEELLRSGTVKRLREELIHTQMLLTRAKQEDVSGANKYEDIKKIWAVAESLQDDIKDILIQWEKTDSTESASGSASEVSSRESSERHSVLILDNIQIDVPVKLFHSGLVNHIESLKSYKLQLVSQKELYSKQKIELGNDIDRFNNQHRKRQELGREQIHLRDKLAEQWKILETTNANPNAIVDFKQIIKALTRAIEKKADLEGELKKIISRKDIIIPGSEELFEEVERVDDYSCTGDCDERLKENHSGKLESETEYNSLRTRLESFIELRTSIKLAEIKQQINHTIDKYNLTLCPKFPPYDETSAKSDLAIARQHLRKLWESSIWLFPSYRSDRLSIDYLEDFAHGHCVSYDNITKRNEFARAYNENINTAQRKFEIANGKYSLSEEVYQNWKFENLNQPTNHNIIEFANTFDSFLECERSYKEALEMEATIVRKLLQKESNMSERIEVVWGDKNLKGKVGYVLKEIFVFNRQFYEKYRVSGSEGGEGSNSGDYMFSGGDGHVESCSQVPGKGGNYACILEGTYFNEYSFPLIRRIKEKKMNQTQSSVLGIPGYLGTGAKAVASFADDIALKYLAKEALPLATGLTNFALVSIPASILVSPVVAWCSSGWKDGPYRTIGKPARNGEKGKASVQLEHVMHEYRKHIDQLPADILGIISIDKMESENAGETGLSSTDAASLIEL